MRTVIGLSVVLFVLCAYSGTAAYAAPVTDKHKQCIDGAIKEGSSAKTAAALESAYQKYFSSEGMAALAARSGWNTFDASRKAQWMEAARSFVINRVVPAARKYSTIPIRYQREELARGGGVNIIGMVGKDTVVWRVITGQCRLLDVSLSGVGSISDFIRSGMRSKERRSSR